MKTTYTVITTWLFIGLILLIALFVILSLWNIASTTRFGEIDFMGYWSATYLLSNGENPYSMERMEEVQRSQIHSTLDVTIMAWNPPFLFVFLLPMAWMSFTTAKFLWLVTNIIIVITAGWMLSYLYLPRVSPRFKLIFLTFVIGFPAVLAGLYMGQVTFLVFLGLVACMVLIKKERWFLAGAVLILTMIKPHMVVLPVIYLLVYMAQQRQYRGWIGLAFAGFTCLSILLIFRSNLIFDLLGETAVAQVSWATSTIGGFFSYLGLFEGARYLILLLLPLPVLLARYPEQFNMELSVALLTLITVPTTLFGWSYDQTILLIPITQVFSWLVHSKYKLPILLCITFAMIVNYYQRLITINDVYYVWVPLFWWVIFGVVWYNSFAEGRHA